MRSLKVITLLCFGIFASFQSYSQYAGGYDYSTEMVWGIMKATNSGLIGGVNFKYSKLLKNNAYHGLGIELANVKHPQEQKYYTISGNTFIWGKEHYLYSIRFSYYRDFILFKKAPQQGVQINLLGAIGPTLGLEAPYYVEVNLGGGITIKEPYDHTNPNHEPNKIVGTGNIFQGVGQSSVVPGINAKIGLAFEFGTFKSNVVGVEVGFQADWFTRKIILIPTTENYSLFPAAYVTLFYGSRK